MIIEITVSKVRDEDKQKSVVLQRKDYARVTIRGDKKLVEEVHSVIEDCSMPDWSTA